MQFLIGSKQEFIDFINQIKKEDNIAILTHTDLDGIASGIFLEKILKSKNLYPKLIKFIDYKNDALLKLKPKLKKEKINKLFILDVSIDSLALDEFNELRKEIDVFLIDHHPMNPLLTDFKNIIKSESSNCAAYVVYELAKNFADLKKENWLLASTMISEFSFKNSENLRLIQSIYPEVNQENIFQSRPGKIYEIISYALIYYNDSLKKVYDLILNKDLKELEKYYNLIKDEINNEIKKFWKNAEFSDNIYFYYFKHKHRTRAMLSTIISSIKPRCSFVLITEDSNDKNYLNASARNQSSEQDMGQLMKKAIQGMENANAGGHISAAGARFMKKDFQKFKENLLDSVLEKLK